MIERIKNKLQLEEKTTLLLVEVQIVLTGKPLQNG